MDPSKINNDQSNSNFEIFPDYPEIPREIGLNILQYLTPSELINTTSLLNNTWKDLSEDNSIWRKFVPEKMRSSNQKNFKEVWKDNEPIKANLEKGNYSHKRVYGFAELFVTQNSVISHPERNFEFIPDYPKVPTEVALSIFQHLSPADLVQVNLVNSSWKLLSDDDSIWQQFIPSGFPSSKISAKEIYHRFFHERDLSGLGSILSNLLVTENYVAFAFLDKNNHLKIQIFDHHLNQCIKTLSLDSNNLNKDDFVSLKSNDEYLYVGVKKDKDDNETKEDGDNTIGEIQIFDLKTLEKKGQVILEDIYLASDSFQVFKDHLYYVSEKSNEVIIYNWKTNTLISKFLPYNVAESDYPMGYRVSILGVTENLLVTGLYIPMDMPVRINPKFWNKSDYSCTIEYPDFIIRDVADNEIYVIDPGKRVKVIEIETGKNKPTFFPLDIENLQESDEKLALMFFKVFDEYMLVPFKDETEEKDVVKGKIWNRNSGQFLCEIKLSSDSYYLDVQYAAGKIIVLDLYERTTLDCYDFNDKVFNPVEQAKKDAQLNGCKTVENILNYGIKDPHALFEIAEIASKQDGNLSLPQMLVKIVTSITTIAPRLASEVALLMPYGVKKNQALALVVRALISEQRYLFASALLRHLVSRELKYLSPELAQLGKVFVEQKNYEKAIDVCQRIEYSTSYILLLKDIAEAFFKDADNLGSAKKFVNLLANSCGRSETLITMALNAILDSQFSPEEKKELALTFALKSYYSGPSIVAKILKFDPRWQIA